MQAGQVLTITPPGSYTSLNPGSINGFLTNAPSNSFRGHSLSVRAQMTICLVTNATYPYMEVGTDNAHNVSLYPYSGSLYATYQEGAGIVVANSIPYSPTTTLYWKISDTGGVFSYLYSSDGVNFTQFASTTVSWSDTSNMFFNLGVGILNTTTIRFPGYVQFDEIKIQ